ATFAQSPDIKRVDEYVAALRRDGASTSVIALMLANFARGLIRHAPDAAADLAAQSISLLEREDAAAAADVTAADETELRSLARPSALQALREVALLSSEFIAAGRHLEDAYELLQGGADDDLAVRVQVLASLASAYTGVANLAYATDQSAVTRELLAQAR